MSYHFSALTGVVKTCKKTLETCKNGGASYHFETEEAATEAYENSQKLHEGETLTATAFNKMKAIGFFLKGDNRKAADLMIDAPLGATVTFENGDVWTKRAEIGMAFENGNSDHWHFSSGSVGVKYRLNPHNTYIGGYARFNVADNNGRIELA